MRGFVKALGSQGTLYRVIPSYSPVARNGRWLPALQALPVIIFSIYRIRREGHFPCHFDHAGSWPSLVREGFLMFFSRIFGVPTILQLHSLATDNYLRHPVGRWLFRVAIFPTSALGVLTPWWKKRLYEAGIRKPIFVIPNPLSQSLEEAAMTRKCWQRREEKSEATVIALAMTRLVEGKGVDSVINALPLVSEKVHLIVAGDGPRKRALEQLVADRGVSGRVTFTGWVDEERKKTLLSSADIFCLPSRNDSFGMCYLEAMAYGLPVIALDWGPIADVVPDGKVGILVKDTSPEQVAGAIQRLLNKDLRGSFGQNGKKWVLQEFSAAAVGRKLGEILPLVCETRKR